MKFRKKPVVINAIQVKAGEIPDFLADEIIAGRIRHTENDTFLIQTLEGVMEASPGDWIIKGVKGEFYPCKPDIFQMTYELAE